MTSAAYCNCLQQCTSAVACIAVNAVHVACQVLSSLPTSMSCVLTAVSGELHKKEQEEQTAPKEEHTTPEADQEQGIATNIKVKEVCQLKPNLTYM